jgi:hypothetical protein
MPDVLEHLAAFLFAPATFFGALFHVLVAGMLLARLRATGASLGATGANQVGKWPTARDNLRRCCADGGAVLTGPQCFQMRFFAGRDQFRTVRGARIATALAGPARRSAGIAHSMMTLVFGVGLLLFLSLREPGRFHRHERRRRNPRQSEFASSHHDRDPCSKDEMDVSVDELR